MALCFVGLATAASAPTQRPLLLQDAARAHLVGGASDGHGVDAHDAGHVWRQVIPVPALGLCIRALALGAATAATAAPGLRRRQAGRGPVVRDPAVPHHRRLPQQLHQQQAAGPGARVACVATRVSASACAADLARVLSALVTSRLTVFAATCVRYIATRPTNSRQ